MLHLNRKVGETVVINDDIRITILEVKRGSVRLGTDSPEGSEVLREELWHRVQNEKAGGETGS